ncbi:uncharacterized protein LOC131948271 [Physella acuta]|uniref:uncharacterized protein LOC131948271 n=1 Tax=Physella acuta TaxID=109671 RepID=UPI0027DE7E53|nr:uncharacterized protein LOC131948271 [Physella acuta]
MIASQNGHDNVVEILIKAGADLNHLNDDGCNSLMIASINGHDKVVDILIEAGADINYVKRDGYNALMIASQNGHAKVADILIKAGAEINYVKRDGYNALMIASQNGHNKVVDILIKARADIHHVEDDRKNALMIASENGHDKVVDILIKAGADINQVEADGWNALMIATQNGHDKVVEILIEAVADINHVKQERCNALMIASKNGQYKIVDDITKFGTDINHVNENVHDTLFSGDGKNETEDYLNTFSLTRTLLLKRDKMLHLSTVQLIDLCFFAFEKKHKHVIDMLSSKNFKIFDNMTSTSLFYYVIFLFQKALNQDVQNDTKNELSDSTVSAQNDADVVNFKRSIDCYVQIVLLSHNNQAPTLDELLEYTTEIMAEYTSLEAFGQLPFFIYQKALKMIDTVIRANYIDKLMTLFQTLREHKYPEKTVSYLKEKNLLDPKEQGFYLSLTRDMLRMLLSGSDESSDFAQTLATNGAVDVFTNIIVLNSIINNSQSRYVTCELIMILHNIARRKGTKELVFFEKLRKTLKALNLPNVYDSLVQKMLLSLIVEDSDIISTTTDEIQTAIDYIKNAAKSPNRKYNGAHLSELLQGLAKFAKYPPACNQILPLLDKLKDFLTGEDLEQLEYTTECLKEMSRDMEASKQILNNKDITNRLTHLNFSGNIDISANVNSIFWRSGRNTGILLNELDKVLSDDFPKEFTVKKETLGQGAFGTVHLVRDRSRKHEHKFVAKKIDLREQANIATLNKKFTENETSFTSKQLGLLTDKDNIVEREEIKKVKRSIKERLIPAVRGDDKQLSDWPLSVLLQGLSKFTERDEYLNEILPLVPRLKEILSHEDIEEIIFTTQCFRELSRLPKASEQIIKDETLSDLLNTALSRGHKDISANVHSIRWRSGRATGMLPSKADFVVSEEFPKEFKIEPSTLALSGFGRIHLVNDINEPKDVKFVTKKMCKKISGTRKDMESFQKEASILIRLKHERIVQFHGFQKTENELFLFLEFVKMGTLSAFIKQHTILNEDVTRRFTVQILEGVKYLHENKVLHLDIKGNNILMADEANIKLTDFGLSTIVNEEGVEAERGTTRYMAPEMINCPEGRIFKHASSLDIWSVGCTVVEMITGSPPNATTTSVQVLFKVAMLQKPKYELPETASEYLKEFLEKTFKEKAAERPSAETLLNEDPFVAGKMLNLNQKNTI